MTEGKIYSSAPSISWRRNGARILLVDEQRGTTVILDDLESAVWKWFALAYSFDDVLDFVQAFLNQPRETARLRLDEILGKWLSLGLLAVAGAA